MHNVIHSFKFNIFGDILKSIRLLLCVKISFYNLHSGLGSQQCRGDYRLGDAKIRYICFSNMKIFLFRLL